MFKQLKHILYITFVFEDRYRFFLDGLYYTLLLTFASFLLGTAVGIGLCASLRSKNKFLNKTARVIITFFMETPTLVLLMILVYVIFGKTSVPLLWAVIIGLMLKAASYLAEIFDTALNTVAPGEIEAARTLGMTGWQAFWFVMLPQTVKAALPLYRNQFIATMQETSVVGYLAVVDLTRAASIVSSRTLDAVVGLLAVTLLYFLIGLLVKALFRLISASQCRKGGAL